jgi:hypothetical protein
LSSNDACSLRLKHPMPALESQNELHEFCDRAALGRRFKPASINWRMAFERVTSCFVAQASSLIRTLVGSLTKTPGSMPPALGGRPRLFLISDIDEGIVLLISEKRAEWKL